jgi:hypothetical protein
MYAEVLAKESHQLMLNLPSSVSVLKALLLNQVLKLLAEQSLVLASL